jgi:hypothetical protein
MPQTEEAAAWFAAVYQAVQEIPHGKVTSYGHIATLVGYPERPRLGCSTSEISITGVLIWIYQDKSVSASNTCLPLLVNQMHATTATPYLGSV